MPSWGQHSGEEGRQSTLLVVADDHRLVSGSLQAFLIKIDPDIEITVPSDFDQALQCAEQAVGLDLMMLDVNSRG